MKATDLTEQQQDEFIRMFDDAMDGTGYDFEEDTCDGNPCPWCCPWYHGREWEADSIKEMVEQVKESWLAENEA